MRRRSYVATLGAVLTAGCLGGGDDDSDEEATDGGDTAEPPANGPDSNGTDDEGQADSTEIFEQQWRTPLEIPRSGGPGHAFAVGGDTVYATHRGGLTALGVESGDQRWDNETDTAFHALAADEQGAFVLRETGEVVAVDPGSGDTLWERQYTDGEDTGWTRLILTDEHVLATSFDRVAIFDRETGEEAGVPGYGAEIVVPYDGQFVVAGHREVRLYEPDGTVVWSTDQLDLRGRPAVVGDTLVWGENGTVTGFDLQAREEGWRIETEMEFVETWVDVAGEMAFVTESHEDLVVAVDTTDPSVAWSVVLDDATHFGPIVLDRAVLLHGMDGRRVEARAHESGEVLGSMRADYDFHALASAGGSRTFVYGGNEVIAHRV